MGLIEENIKQLRHDEMLEVLGKVLKAVSAPPKDDPQLKKLLTENQAAIVNFVEAARKLGAAGQKEVVVNTNQEQVVLAIGGLAEKVGEILDGIDKRLTALENKPRPIRIKANYGNGFNGQRIDYVDIEYSK